MIDWSRALDLERASRNVRTDIFGDWHRDPWSWPEQEWLLSKDGMPYVLHTLNDTGVRRSLSLDVPKENFSTRPALVFDPVDRLSFQALVDRISTKIIGKLPRWSYSWRLSRRSPMAGRYLDMRAEWKGYRERLKAISGLYDSALTTDIVSFFPSIPIDRLIDRVYECAGSSSVTDRLADMLRSWDRMVGRGGLPMRANASSVLASMYLQPIDDVLLSHGKSMVAGRSLFMAYALAQGTASRWVDDVWLFGADRADLRAAQMDLQEAMRSLGLHMNLGKTEVLDGEEMMAKARQLEHSAVEVALLEDDKPDYQPLDALLDRIIAKPEVANHTSVRFATVQMRRHHRFQRVEELVAVADRMPHASDSLARLFRESGKHADLGEWFVEYLHSNWSKIQLGPARFGTMFPSAEAPPRIVIEALSERVMAGGVSLSLLSLAAQRLAAWEKDDARSLFRELAKTADHPQVRRVLALAALNAGETRHWVSRLLGEFQENAVTLNLLRERRFNPVPPTADFVSA